jgi:hypothetical protein
MCSAQADVRQVPRADISQTEKDRLAAVFPKSDQVVVLVTQQQLLSPRDLRGPDGFTP